MALFFLAFLAATPPTRCRTRISLHLFRDRDVVHPGLHGRRGAGAHLGRGRQRFGGAAAGCLESGSARQAACEQKTKDARRLRAGLRLSSPQWAPVSWSSGSTCMCSSWSKAVSCRHRVAEMDDEMRPGSVLHILVGEEPEISQQAAAQQPHASYRGGGAEQSMMDFGYRAAHEEAASSSIARPGTAEVKVERKVKKQSSDGGGTQALPNHHGGPRRPDVVRMPRIGDRGRGGHHAAAAAAAHAAGRDEPVAATRTTCKRGRDAGHDGQNDAESRAPTCTEPAAWSTTRWAAGTHPPPRQSSWSRRLRPGTSRL